MVLFLFIIMLLDLKAESRRKVNFLAFGAGAFVVALFAKILFTVCYGFQGGNAKFPATVPSQQGDTWHIGMTLFQQYNLPLQVVGTLILVASIGVVILSKRELK
jgi:NADH-quinone oxidoreductase subunit J